MYYIGIMSGTSIDAVDAVLVSFTDSQSPRLVNTCTLDFPTQLQQLLNQLCVPNDNEIENLGVASNQLAKLYAQAVIKLLEKSKVSSEQISAIGCHGQTIRHRPNQPNPFTLQIGDHFLLAELTNIDVIADFRSRDIALGGQGAPLVPAFHQAVFSQAQKDTVILNLGGIANITYLPADSSKPLLGFDTGPANTLLDTWINKHLNVPYDKDGDWAEAGTLDKELLATLLADPYFQLPAPKSTGREYFSIEWLSNFITNQKPNDVQATILELTAISVADHINSLTQNKNATVYVCGGGVFNQHLLARLSHHLNDTQVHSSAALGIDPTWVEAMAFAWLAHAYDHNIPGNAPSVTGASKAAVLGVKYSAD